jgi:hypothetical protein
LIDFIKLAHKNQLEDFVNEISQSDDISEEEIQSNMERNKHLIVGAKWALGKMVKMFHERMKQTSFFKRGVK